MNSSKYIYFQIKNGVLYNGMRLKQFMLFPSGYELQLSPRCNNLIHNWRRG